MKKIIVYSVRKGRGSITLKHLNILCEEWENSAKKFAYKRNFFQKIKITYLRSTYCSVLFTLTKLEPKVLHYFGGKQVKCNAVVGTAMCKMVIPPIHKI